MSIVRWNPVLAPSFRTLVENFFGDGDPMNLIDRSISPAVNIRETEEAFLIELAAPGLKKEDFKVDIHNGVLTVSAEQKEEKQEKKGEYTRREFSFTKFSRAFTLPGNVNGDQIQANYQNGLLTLDLPKIAKTSPAVKNIAIN